MKLGVLFLLLFAGSLTAFTPLSEEYLVSYGDPDAEVKIVQYYSFTCPHCVALFRREFQEIREKYIEKGSVHWTFHPVPIDLLTVQAMDCLQKLAPREKRIFLEAVLEELIIDEPLLSASMMQKGMELLHHPIANLQEKSYLEKTPAFLDAFHFLKQEKQLTAVPAVEVNGLLIPGQIPDGSFLTRLFSTKGDLQ